MERLDLLDLDRRARAWRSRELWRLGLLGWAVAVGALRRLGKQRRRIAASHGEAR